MKLNLDKKWMNLELKPKVFLFFAILYFFFNNAFLPHGLLFTAMLTPLFAWWLFVNKKITQIAGWTVLLIIPVPFHLYLGFDVRSYTVSTALVLTAWVFLFTAIEAIKQMRNNLETIFKSILYIGVGAVLIALFGVFFPVGREFFWNYGKITPRFGEIYRLMMLAYEPSHFALLLCPVWIFFLLKAIFLDLKHPVVFLIAILLPLILSLSFGVIGAMGIALVVGLAVFFKNLPKVSKKYIFYVAMAGILVVVLMLIIWPANPVFVRLENILNGTDTSSNGRLQEAFGAAYYITNSLNSWFGVGPGQIKLLALKVLPSPYLYAASSYNVYRIPNGMAELLATYGIYGFILKIGVEIFFFFKLKIYKNLYSFTLFIFIFIYQFTGSFLVNVAELGIWALVFQSRFKIVGKQKIREFGV